MTEGAGTSGETGMSGGGVGATAGGGLSSGEIWPETSEEGRSSSTGAGGATGGGAIGGGRSAGGSSGRSKCAA